MKFLIVSLLLCVALVSGSPTRFVRRNDADPVDFTGHKVLRLKPGSLDQAAQLRQLESEFELDYWNPVLDDLRSVLAIIDPQRESFLLALNQSKIGYEIVTNNYQQVVDAERTEMKAAKARDPNFDYENSYHTYEEILAQLKYLADTYPAATYINVGTSYEGREIPALSIGTGSQVIILENGIHAREWVTVAFGVWVSNFLLTQASLAPYLSTYTFIVIPVLNVDGFWFTHNGNRLWRKTRSPNSGSTCLGSDPNRNFDSAFGQAGSSTNPCSETFSGPAPFSEVETTAAAALINQYASKTAAYFAIHSYSQLWMYPHGYTNALPPNNDRLKALSQAALTAIKATNGLDFVEGTIANAIYLSSGCSADWAYDVAGIQISFAIELRDQGQYGFQLPASQIRPAVYETWAGVKAVLDAL